jgi:hypothetical protein
MPRILAPFLLPGSDDPENSQNRCRLPPSQGNFWQTPLFTNAQAMIAYWRVRKWRVDITVSGSVVGSIGCDVEMNIANESQLVCSQVASGLGEAEMEVSGEGYNSDVFLYVDVSPLGIFIRVEFNDFPEGGDSLTEWGTTNSSGSNQITLTMGGITKNLVGEYSGSGFPVPIATGTMNAVEWWSYDGLYNTSTGEPL